MWSGNMHHDSEVSSNELDRQQWVAFKGGNSSAYARLYDTYFHILFKYGFKITRNRNLVLDAIQDLFIELWRNRKQLSTPPSIKNYLFKSLRRKLYRQITFDNKTLLPEPVESYLHAEPVSPKEQQLIDEQLTHEQTYELTKAVQSLTRRQREIVFLKFYQNLNYDEISKIMGIGIDAVYNVLSKAIHNLQKKTKKVVLLILFLVTISFLF